MCANWKTSSAALSALYPQEVINSEIIEAELRGNDPFPEPAGRASNGGPTDISTASESWLAGYFAGFGNDLPPPGLYHRVLRQLEQPLITATLAATRGNQIKAAELLGVNRNTLRKKIRELDIKVIRTLR